MRRTGPWISDWLSGKEALLQLNQRPFRCPNLLFKKSKPVCSQLFKNSACVALPSHDVKAPLLKDKEVRTRLRQC